MDVAGDVAEDVEEVVVKPAPSGYHLLSGDSWKHQGLQVPQQLVGLVLTLRHLEP